MDFLKNLKISDEQQGSQGHSQSGQKKESNLFSKIGDALEGRKTPPPPPPAPARKEGLFDQIGDVLGGRKTPPPAHAPAKKDNIFDQIGGALGGRKTPPPAQPQGLLGQLGGVLGGKKQEPARPQGLGDKLNHALGGGAAGEAKEGKLDKAIDLFQEHVLKEGAQHNESAMEQLKDKQIASTIRKTLGMPEKK